METKTKFRRGDRVHVVNSDKYRGLSGVVEKQLPKNVDVMLDNGKRVRFDPYFLIPGDGDAPSTTAVEIPTYVPPPMPGTVVRVKDTVVARYPKLEGLWIVGGGQGDKSRLFRLNNTDGQYWRILNEDLIRVEADLVPR